MELLFLGAGAGEMWPAPFCTCERCADARREGNVLPGTSVLIDGRYLIDAPNGLALNLALLGVEVAFPFHVFITHSHQDHFSPGELLCATNDPDHKVVLHMNATSRSLLEHYTRFNRFFDLERFPNYQAATVEPFRPVDTEKGTRFIPILADHDDTLGEEPLNYIVERGGKTLLYACDTGWYADRTWEEVLRHRYDAVVLECTWMATKTDGRGHLDIAHFLRFVDVLRKAGCLAANARIVAAHFHWHDFDRAAASSLQQSGIELAARGTRLTC